MGKSEINVSCNDQVLKITYAPVLAAGGLNEVRVVFNFCEKWAGFAKTAIFYRDEEEVYYAVLDENDTCVVPWEVCYEEGAFYFGVFGEKDSIRRTSNVVRYKVKKGAITADMKPSDPSPDVYDQIMALLADSNKALKNEINRAVAKDAELEKLFTAPTEEAVAKWLDEHPEATTNVEDKSLTIDKFTEYTQKRIIKDYVTPQMFGAVGDGVTDDTNALLLCVEHCKANNTLFYIPQDTTILIPESTIVSGLKQIEIRGKIKAPNGIEFRYNSNLAGNEWYFNHIEGALTLSGLKDALITVIYADSLILLADSSVSGIGSIAYCQFVLGYVKTITLQGGENGGWINDNYFYGGRVRDLTLNGSYSHNNNHFYNNSFENANIVFNTGRSNYIHNARFEGSPTVTFSSKSANNYVHKAWMGETIPGVSSKPGTWWSDPSGLNYFYAGINPPIKVIEKKFTANTFNYSCDKMYPLSGKLHNKSYNSNMVKTDFIDINHVIGVNVSSEAKFFRVFVTLYDENKTPIKNEPTEYIFHGCTMTWDADGYYRYGSSSVALWSCSISQCALLTGNDSGVRYIKISINGYDSADVDRFSFKISVPWYVDIYPFEAERMTATAIPAAGEWKDGLIAYNTNPEKPCMGWFYNNGAWHEIGTYTT